MIARGNADETTRISGRAGGGRMSDVRGAAGGGGAPARDRRSAARRQGRDRVARDPGCWGARRDHRGDAGGTARARRRATDDTAALTLTAAPVGARPDAVELVSTARPGARATATAHADRPDVFGLVARQLRAAAGRLLRRQPLPVAAPAAYPPLLTEPADIGPNVPPIVPDIPRLSAGAGPSALRRRRGRAGDARARASCAGARGWASSCSPSRRRRRGRWIFGARERRPDARVRHGRATRAARRSADGGGKPARGDRAAARAERAAARVRLRRRARAVRAAVRAAQGADRADRAGARTAVLRGCSPRTRRA